MAALLKKIRNRGKHEETPSSATAVEETVVSEETSTEPPVVKGSPSPEESPNHRPVAVSGSLFSGMKLTKTARKQESESSPYLKRLELNIDDDKTENNSSSDTSQLGFSFIKASQQGTSLSFGDVENTETLLQTCSSSTTDKEPSEPSAFGFIVQSPSEGITPPPHTVPSLIHAASQPTHEMNSSQRTLISNSKVARQQPPSTRKKKHKAIRPGQERLEDVGFEGLSSLSTLSSHNSENQEGVLSLNIETNVLNEARPCDDDLDNENVSINVEDGANDTPNVSIQDDAVLNTAHDAIVDGSDTDGATVQKPDACAADEQSQSSMDLTGAESPNIGSEEVNFVSGKDEEYLKSETMMETESPSTGFEEANVVSNEGEDVLQNETLHESTDYPPDKDSQCGSLQAYEMKLLQIKSELEQLNVEYHEKIERTIKALQLRISRQEDIQNLKFRVEEALTKENYELAEEISREIETAESGESVPLRDTHVFTKEWLEKSAILMKREIELSEEMTNGLNQIKDEQSKELQMFDKNFMLQHAKKKMDLQTMTDKVEKEKGHILLDKDHLDRKQKILQDEVCHRAADFISCKESLEKDKIEVDNEIEALEDRLKQLKERRLDITNLIIDEDNKIKKVHEELSSMQEELDKEKGLLEQAEEDLQQQMVALEELQVSYDTAVTEHETKKQSLLHLVKSSTESCEKIDERKKQLENAVFEAHQWTLDNIPESIQPTDKLMKYVTETEDKQAKLMLETERTQDDMIKTVTAEVVSCQTELSTLHRHLHDVESQLPKIQESKKNAVTARQYREASKLAAEEKEFLPKIENMKQKIVLVDSDLASKNSLLSKLSGEFSALKEKRAVLERDEDIGHIQTVLIAVTQQETLLKKFEGFSSVPLYDVIVLWCKILELLVKDYCGKHGLDAQVYLSNREYSVVKPSEDNESHLLNVDEERTPGVGMEDPLLDSMDHNENTKTLKLKIADIESRIGKACEEENFDVAAELDEELATLKSELQFLEN